jgi:hypothetical protein
MRGREAAVVAKHLTKTFSVVIPNEVRNPSGCEREQKEGFLAALGMTAGAFFRKLQIRAPKLGGPKAVFGACAAGRERDTIILGEMK